MNGPLSAILYDIFDAVQKHQPKSYKLYVDYIINPCKENQVDFVK